MKSFFHALFGIFAILVITVFWISTAVSELFLDHSAVAFVKRSVIYGLFLLVPFLALTGLSGIRLGQGRSDPLIAKKKMRMRVVAANGLLVLVPATLYLNGKASLGRFDAAFYTVQSIELSVGLFQIVLLGLNLRDGFRLAGKLRFVP
jgi:hypothetical protein